MLYRAKNQVMLAETPEKPGMLIAKHTVGLFYLVVSLIILWGCAATSEKLRIKDISKSFDEGAIISGRTGRPVSFGEVAADLNGTRVVYVGERHPELLDHQIQLKVIQALYDNHQNMTVGMEMFDRSYQPVLDLWSRGALDEEAFLRRTQWYANWGYDFSLYREILEFIKNYGIKLVALNIPFCIPPKIMYGGIEDLPARDKIFIPEQIDTGNKAYRDYIQKIFKEHHFRNKARFADFFMAQCVWDEAMAESIARHLNDDMMVVLAGNGHIQYKYGIPQRAFRRTDAAYRTIYPAGAGSEAELTVADYIWVTP
jgi:uncharacterized iron-regulated protein